MLRILARAKYRALLPALGLLCAAAGLLTYPQQSMQAARQGLDLCANVIVPSLFPFFVLSSLVVELGMAGWLGRALERVMYPLFRVSGAGAGALVLGFVGGYPVGARTAIRLYEKGLCSRAETERLLAFCNNSGPAFILGVVGVGVFGSSRVGLLLYLVHMAAGLLVGLVFRFHGPAAAPRPRSAPVPIHTVRFSRAFTHSVTGSARSVLSICAFVVLFGVVIRLLVLCGAMDRAAACLELLGLDPALSRRLLTGLVELSSGVTSLSPGGDPAHQIPLAAFLLGWAGLSVHCQVLSFLADSDLHMGTYLTGKLLHGLFSALLTLLVTRLFPLSMPVSSYLADQVDSLAQLDFTYALSICTACAWTLWVFFLAVTVYMVGRCKKRGGKAG